MPTPRNAKEWKVLSHCVLSKTNKEIRSDRSITAKPEIIIVHIKQQQCILIACCRIRKKSKIFLLFIANHDAIRKTSRTFQATF